LIFNNIPLHYLLRNDGLLGILKSLVKD